LSVWFSFSAESFSGVVLFMLRYDELSEENIDRDLFRGFIRRQVVTECWRKENGVWKIKNVPFVDDWTEEDYNKLVVCLKHTAGSGGFVFAAFFNEILKGFVSVEPELFGGDYRYLDLSSIHVSQDFRGRGIGRRLFEAAKVWATKKGVRRLYISAHSSVESQAFYKAMGCVEAVIVNEKHIQQEPFDCQLECKL